MMEFEPTPRGLDADHPWSALCRAPSEDYGRPSLIPSNLSIRITRSIRFALCWAGEPTMNVGWMRTIPGSPADARQQAPESAPGRFVDSNHPLHTQTPHWTPVASAVCFRTKGATLVPRSPPTAAGASLCLCPSTPRRPPASKPDPVRFVDVCRACVMLMRTSHATGATGRVQRDQCTIHHPAASPLS
jgi:hypothetical protein